MKDYEIVVGLEVHAELNTKSKIYCNCRNAFGLEVNTQVCPVCMGMPGTLPTLNEKVVEYAIKMGRYGRRTDEENWRNPYPYRRRCRKAAA